MHISEKGIQFIEGFEGFSATQYDDGTGVMTIGYGTTSSDVSPLPTYMSRAEAERFLRKRLADRYEPAVNGLGVPLNQNQFDALVSFVYNLGPGSMQWDVGRYLRAHNYRAAADAMLQYDHAGGQVMLGLTRRRQAERAMFLAPPPPPPDPHHYAWFSNGKTIKRGHVLIERDLVIKYDTLRPHPILHAVTLRWVKTYLTWLADDVYNAAHRDKDAHGHPSWDKNNRGWRYQQLTKRAHGEKVV